MQKLVLLVFTSLTFLEFNPFTPSFTEKYLQRYSQIAIAEMNRSGIPASIKLAQGLLESNWGRSDLAKTANNHFGIKCGFGWDGGSFYKEDDDFKDGKLVKSCFRAYNTPDESYIAHTEFLSRPRKSKRYDFLFQLAPTDYVGWAKGLQKAGYATDPSYPKKLIGIIEKYNLTQYDVQRDYIVRETIVKKKKTEDDNRILVESVNEEIVDEAIVETETDELEPFKTMLEYINNVPMVRAGVGETPLSIAQRSGLTYDQLAQFNEQLPGAHEICGEGSIVYLERKKRKYGKASSFHRIKEGETMYSISQLYGIKLANLYSKNRMPKGSEAFVGEKLNLGSLVKVGRRPKFKTDRKLKSEKKEFLFDDLFSTL